jgi:hypothetical protein
MTTLPDVLRLAPGVDVAQVNSNKWAVSVRGFNALYANKLLVLVDGRNVYNKIFSGVLWDTEDLPLDDIDRIEVIRGPGAAMWGANAVNAVINIVTKTAANTQGALVRVEAGRAGNQGAVRYGGKAAFLFNFAKFAEWPVLPSGGPIVLCVVGNDPVAVALAETVRGQNIGGHPLDVLRPPDSSARRTCQLLFITDADARRSSAGLSAIKAAPVLTISDSKGLRRPAASSSCTSMPTACGSR